mmetsp:Transcript_8161/g.17585  ORF Transcript_8161/g.17585 Transcript_8161/m.17585 type:complete len:104 (+) Transcript_8161:1283-1594(+)
MSGADISTLCKDAAMVPIRNLTLYTHFRLIQGGDGVSRYYPCVAEHDAAMKMRLHEIPRPDLVQAPPVTAADFETAFTKTKPSVAATDLARYEQFTSEFGQDG